MLKSWACERIGQDVIDGLHLLIWCSMVGRLKSAFFRWRGIYSKQRWMDVEKKEEARLLWGARLRQENLRAMEGMESALLVCRADGLEKPSCEWSEDLLDRLLRSGFCENFIGFDTVAAVIADRRPLGRIWTGDMVDRLFIKLLTRASPL